MKKKSIDITSKIVKINRDDLELLIMKPEFQKDVIGIRKKLNIDICGFNSDESLKNWHHEDMRTNEAGNMIQLGIESKSLLDKYEFPISFEQTMTFYILRNKLTFIPGRNYSFNFLGRHINVSINARPTKEEWVEIRKQVNEFLDIVKSGKFKNVFKDIHCPRGSKVARPKPKLERNLEILKKSKLLGQEIDASISDEDIEKYKYTDGDIEADVFPIGSVKQSKKNKNNIRAIRSRYKPKN